MTEPDPASILQCFAPVTRPDTRVLVLGSLPGIVSLERRQYYAHPQNLFWRLIGGVVEEELVKLGYETRLSRLLDHGIGLWDTVAAGNREHSSLDADIVVRQSSDLSALVTSLPQLQAVAFNGKKAAQVGRPQLPNPPAFALLDLPSSSPAHAAMPYDEKLSAWLSLRRYLAKL